MKDPSVGAYAVLGHPVAHSLSPRIHAAFAAATGERIEYGAIDVPPDGLAAFLVTEAGRGLAGANVTLPHKEAALQLAQEASDRARSAGAANTLSRRADGGWDADNTDGIGLCRDLTENLGWPLADRRILIVGAGGATRGILGPLLETRPAGLIVANRTVARAEQLARDFGIDAAGLDGVAGEWDAVIHASAAGHGGGGLALPGARIRDGGWAYDLSYGKAAAPFLAWAMDVGATHCSDGLGMLVEQAAESFTIWRGTRPPTATVLADLRAG